MDEALVPEPSQKDRLIEAVEKHMFVRIWKFDSTFSRKQRGYIRLLVRSSHSFCWLLLLRDRQFESHIVMIEWELEALEIGLLLFEYLRFVCLLDCGLEVIQVLFVNIHGLTLLDMLGPHSISALLTVVLVGVLLFGVDLEGVSIGSSDEGLIGAIVADVLPFPVVDLDPHLTVGEHSQFHGFLEEASLAFQVRDAPTGMALNHLSRLYGSLAHAA